MIHYQIQRKGEDALFTLSEGKKISHGLDSLVNYYMNERQTGLQHTLTDWVPGIGCVVITLMHVYIDGLCILGSNAECKYKWIQSRFQAY